MRIGIIGAGKVDNGLAAASTGTGHDVVVAALRATRGWTWQSAFRLVGPQNAA